MAALKSLTEKLSANSFEERLTVEEIEEREPGETEKEEEEEEEESQDPSPTVYRT